MMDSDRERKALRGRAVDLFATGLALLISGAGLFVWAPGPWGAALGAFAMLCGVVIGVKTLLLASSLKKAAEH